jgi:peptidoglycan/LPS O-acetylase OafA/YrhL
MEKESSDRKNERYSLLDFLKGLSILFIIATHFGWTGKERLQFGFPFWIDMAVPFFLLISGYLQALFFDRKGIRSIDEAFQKDKIAKKLQRYFLPYCLVFIVEAVILLFMKKADAKQLLYAFVTGGFGPGSYYFPIIIQMIFVVPFSYVIVRKYRFRGVVYAFLVNLFFELIKFPFFMPPPQYRLLFFRYIFILSCGVFACFMTEFHVWYWLISAAGIFFVIISKYSSLRKSFAAFFCHWEGTSLFNVMMVVPLFWYLTTKIKKIRIRGPITRVGTITYEIFLTQMAYYYFLSISGIAKRISMNRGVRLVLNYIIILGIAVAFHQLLQVICRRRRSGEVKVSFQGREKV